jgi:hypothetical protein
MHVPLVGTDCKHRFSTDTAVSAVGIETEGSEAALNFLHLGKCWRTLGPWELLEE